MKTDKLTTMAARITLIILVLILSSINSNAQEWTFEEKAKILSEKIEQITGDERATLKVHIKEINRRLSRNEINENEAQILKKQAAENSAQNIQNRVAVIEKQLQDLIKNKVDTELFTENNRKRFSIGGLDVDYGRNNRRGPRRKENRRTSHHTVFAFGLNNLVTEKSLNSIEDSEFGFWNSHFLEFGSNHKTRVFKNTSLLYVNYGFSVMYNKLRPKSNQYFVKDDNFTLLETSAIDLNKSKFKNVQLVLPVFLELDFSKQAISGDRIAYKRNRSVRIGAGGFVGINIKSKQILKYKEDDIRVRDVQKGDFNVNNFVYGLSAFVGHGDVSFYAKYNLNELFSNAQIAQNNISFGIRFDCW